MESEASSERDEKQISKPKTSFNETEMPVFDVSYWHPSQDKIESKASSEHGEKQMSKPQTSFKEMEMPVFDVSYWHPSNNDESSVRIRDDLSHTPDQHDTLSKMKVSAMHRRVRRVAMVDKMLKHIRGKDKLVDAISKGNLDAVVGLLEEGVSPNTSDSKERTPLHFAASKGNERIVGVLLEHGANPNTKDGNGNTPLHLAACTSHISVVTLLLRAGADASLVDNRGHNPLHLAASRLRLFREDTSSSAQELISEIQNVSNMILQYWKSSGQDDKLQALHGVSEKLLASTTRQEVDEVNDLLSKLTNMEI